MHRADLDRLAVCFVSPDKLCLGIHSGVFTTCNVWRKTRHRPNESLLIDQSLYAAGSRGAISIACPCGNAKQAQSRSSRLSTFSGALINFISVSPNKFRCTSLTLFPACSFAGRRTRSGRSGEAGECAAVPIRRNLSRQIRATEVSWLITSGTGAVATGSTKNSTSISVHFDPVATAPGSDAIILPLTISNSFVPFAPRHSAVGT